MKASDSEHQTTTTTDGPQITKIDANGIATKIEGHVDTLITGEHQEVIFDF